MESRRDFIRIICIIVMAVFILGCGKNLLEKLQEWDLVYISDSTGWGVAEKYAENIREDTGKIVRVKDHAIGRCCNQFQKADEPFMALLCSQNVVYRIHPLHHLPSTSHKSHGIKNRVYKKAISNPTKTTQKRGFSTSPKVWGTYSKTKDKQCETK